MSKTALQLYSIREMMEDNVSNALKQTCLSGYEGVEFAGFYDIKAEQMMDILNENGLSACGSHTALDIIERNFDEVISYNKTINNYNIIVPFIAEKYRKSANDWETTAKMFNDIGRKFYDEGFTFAYHNHDFEFEKFHTVTGYQVLAQNIDPKYVKLQPDLGWVAFSGIDVESFLEKYKELILNIHVKQFKKVGSHEATEIHKGIVDYNPIIKKCKNLGIEWLIVEQEGFDIPIVESIKQNCDELKKMILQ